VLALVAWVAVSATAGVAFGAVMRALKARRARRQCPLCVKPAEVVAAAEAILESG
jgi:hypothetical protein